MPTQPGFYVVFILIDGAPGVTVFLDVLDASGAEAYNPMAGNWEFTGGSAFIITPATTLFTASVQITDTGPPMGEVFTPPLNAPPPVSLTTEMLVTLSGQFNFTFGPGTTGSPSCVTTSHFSGEFVIAEWTSGSTVVEYPFSVNLTLTENGRVMNFNGDVDLNNANIYTGTYSTVSGGSGCTEGQSYPTGYWKATRAPTISPSISFTASAATGTSPFAAGQLISIYGSQLGPVAGTGPQLGPGDVVTSSNNSTKVLFDGMPAPIIYTSADQVNTVIPCAVAGHASTQVVGSYLGAQSPPVTLPLSTAAPGIFTVNGTGSGQAAVLNADGTLNGPSNPAARGSEVVLYATGVGPTSPCVDGQVYQSNYPTLTLPVVVGVANIGAQVVYAGQAPYLVSGVAQINFIIPSDSPTGVVALNMEAGGVFSPAGVTVSVK